MGKDPKLIWPDFNQSFKVASSFYIFLHLVVIFGVPPGYWDKTKKHNKKGAENQGCTTGKFDLNLLFHLLFVEDRYQVVEQISLFLSKKENPIIPVRLLSLKTINRTSSKEKKPKGDRNFDKDLVDLATQEEIRT